MKIGQNNKTVQAQKLIQTGGSDIDNWVKYFILQPILLILVQGVNKNRLNISCPKIEEINQLGGQLAFVEGFCYQKQLYAFPFQRNLTNNLHI